jgi:hypothetical protein
LSSFCDSLNGESWSNINQLLLSNNCQSIAGQIKDDIYRQVCQDGQ